MRELDILRTECRRLGFGSASNEAELKQIGLDWDLDW